MRPHPHNVSGDPERLYMIALAGWPVFAQGKSLSQDLL